MVTTLDGYIREYNDLVPEIICTDLINKFEVDQRKVEVDRECRPRWTELNITEHRDEVAYGEIQEQMQQYFVDAVKLYMEDLQCGYDFPPKYCFEQYRVKKYRMNTPDQFREHVDVQDHASARRFLVVMLYLNNVTRGGETYFPLLQRKVQPETGKILIFPSTWQWRHAGLPVESNHKYILGSYLHYL